MAHERRSRWRRSPRRLRRCRPAHAAHAAWDCHHANLPAPPYRRGAAGAGAGSTRSGTLPPGIGTSGRAGMEQTYGVNFRAPLGHLREYLRIVKTLLHTGSVDFAGLYYQAHTRISAPIDVPVMAAALGEKAYELCGAEADGAISWVCAGAYLRDVALPALHRGADSAGRPVPALVAHAPVCVHDHAEEVRAALRSQFGGFARAPFYQHMFRAAGFKEV